MILKRKNCILQMLLCSYGKIISIVNFDSKIFSIFLVKALVVPYKFRQIFSFQRK